MELRDYQQQCLEAICARFREGVYRQLVTLPTGSGKTVIFAHLPQALGLGRDERMLTLAHRDELIQQSAAKLRAANPNASVGIEMAERKSDANNEIASPRSKVWQIGSTTTTRTLGHSFSLPGRGSALTVTDCN